MSEIHYFLMQLSKASNRDHNLYTSCFCFSGSFVHLCSGGYHSVLTESDDLSPLFF